jgi:hypothetical protein
MRASISDVSSEDGGRTTAEIEFSARREERILLHLLVRLHELA